MTYNFSELQAASTGKLTFVSKSKAELHKNVRKFLVDSVKAYQTSGSHKLDAKVGLRVALEFSKSYGLHMRSALSKVNGTVAWTYDKSGAVSYNKVDIARKPESVADVLKDLNAALDTIDADNVKPETSEAVKLERAAKSANTMLMNCDAAKLAAMGEAAKGLSGDEYANYIEALSTLLSQAQAQLKLEVVAS